MKKRFYYRIEQLNLVDWAMMDGFGLGVY